MLPHLDAAYNLARWMTGNDQDAQDVVQEAYLRAFKAFSGYADTNSAGWILKVVRNTCLTWLKQNRGLRATTSFDEEVHTLDAAVRPGCADPMESSPDALAGLASDGDRIQQALEELPLEFREVVVLRELAGFSYKEIAEMLGIPPGTVMSRLSRGRRQLREILGGSSDEDTRSEL
jgi:RNA polymerase sigma factor (sigma-70 family)